MSTLVPLLAPQTETTRFHRLAQEKCTAETVPKSEISLVEHGFSRAKTLASNQSENLKVYPTHKNMSFGMVSPVIPVGGEERIILDNKCF